MNKRHRIFIAINLSEDVKNKLAEYQEKWPELASAVRWTKKDNLHITLIFLGYLNDEEVLEVSKIIKEAAETRSPFLVNLSKICYGPPKKMPPRMVWAVGESFSELTSLHNNLSKVLEGPSFQQSLQQHFSLHITLGRIKSFEWRRIEPEERPEVDEDIDLSFEVSSIELMESELKRGGPEYTIIESFLLSN